MIRLPEIAASVSVLTLLIVGLQVFSKALLACLSLKSEKRRLKCVELLQKERPAESLQEVSLAVALAAEPVNAIEAMLRKKGSKVPPSAEVEESAAAAIEAKLNVANSKDFL